MAVAALLDYVCIAAHPKPFIGFSDVTTLHLAIQQRCGFVAFHGPTANRTLGWQDDLFSCGACGPRWNGGVYAGGESAGEDIQVCAPAGPAAAHRRQPVFGDHLSGYAMADRCQKLHPLPGGCGEDVYALEEMLWQLKYNGTLDAAVGLVFGRLPAAATPIGGTMDHWK